LASNRSFLEWPEFFLTLKVFSYAIIKKKPRIIGENSKTV
jgi:hypothetical protein